MSPDIARIETYSSGIRYVGRIVDKIYLAKKVRVVPLLSDVCEPFCSLKPRDGTTLLFWI